jgi:preprotein translocase subunit SecG
VTFVVLAIVMAAVAVETTSEREIDDSLERIQVPAAGAQQAPAAPAQPAQDDPLAGVAQ